MRPSSLKIAGPELNRPWEPSGTVHPWVNADEQVHLQVHAKQQRGFLPARVEIELVTTIKTASVSDLETMPVGRRSSASVPAGCKGVADQFALGTRPRLDREFEWGSRGDRAHENLGATFSECLFDAGDDGAST
jgi:hypothetical protein